MKLLQCSTQLVEMRSSSLRQFIMKNILHPWLHDTHDTDDGRSEESHCHVRCQMIDSQELSHTDHINREELDTDLTPHGNTSLRC